MYVVENDLGAVASYFASSIRPKHDFFLVGAAVGGEGGLAETIAEASVDILITDCRLSEADGLELIMQTKEIRPAIRAVLMTSSHAPDITVRALLAGADAVLFKPFDADELFNCLRAILSGQRVLCIEAARHISDFLRQIVTVPASDPATNGLSSQETELLGLLGQNLLLKEVADRMEVSVETARTYRKRIFAKYQVHSTRAALDSFFGNGRRVIEGAQGPDGEVRRASPALQPSPFVPLKGDVTNYPTMSGYDRSK